MMHKRSKPPERKEIAALSTGDSTEARRRALTGPWMEIKKPAATMTRMGSRRIGVVEWWSGGVVEWWSGGVVEWWSGVRLIFCNSFSRISFLEKRELLIINR
jgi:hypothetical protein